ncbi:MAG: DUF262 domain-containing protein [Nostoc sp. NMS8]|nr:DUF262 domain-containing protein [Nostoc sp. NMS8]
MECRPELVDKESELVRVNKGFGKAQAQDFYQPLWLGLGYRLKREGTQGSEDSSGIHGTKSVHWRRGFLRNQPYGEGRQQRKLVWIEPVIDNESQSVGNWNDVKKSKLIESFIINFPIMPIVMYEKSYHTYKVIDGKQRLKAIVDFYSNQLVLSGLEVKTELNGCTYATLPYHAKTVLNRHSLSLISIIPSEDASPEEIAKIIEIIAERLN